jgi:hypothetical protein
MSDPSAGHGALVAVQDKGHVRTIALNRPDKMNALSHALAWAIVTEVQKAAHDDDVWVIALTGRGRAFCAGLDLTGPGEDVSPLSGQERLMDDVSWVGRFALVLRHECDKPVVAGLNGVAAGAGLSLAMAADMRIMARGARLVAGPHRELPLADHPAHRCRAEAEDLYDLRDARPTDDVGEMAVRGRGVAGRATGRDDRDERHRAR